jgi:condensin complex subunit 3
MILETRPRWSPRYRLGSNSLTGPILRRLCASLSFILDSNLLLMPCLSSEADGVKLDEAIQFDLATQMVKTLYQEEQSKSGPVPCCDELADASPLARAEDERKLLCQLLPKLYIPDEIVDVKVKSLLWLVSSLKLVRFRHKRSLSLPSVPDSLSPLSQNRPLADTVSKNALDRFEKALIKSFGERVKALSSEELAQAVEYKETQNWVDSIVGEDGDEDEEKEDEDEDEEESEEEESDGAKGELEGEGAPDDEEEED